jgi:hypothetical protein
MGNPFGTPEQKTFFETFGFLHLPGLMKEDIGWIIDDYEAVWRSRPDIVHGAKGKATSFPALFVQQTPRLSSLIEHPRIESTLNMLLGDAWNINGGDGTLYDGDTGWHSDIAQGLWKEESVARNVKVAFYLDPLTRDTGALRVIPGSHLYGDHFCEQLTKTLSDMKSLGISGAQVPALALECQPGDVVMFDHRLKHASFGGGKRRRLMNLNVMESIRNEEQKEAMRNLFRFYRNGGTKWEFDKAWVDAMPPERLRHFSMTLEIGKEVMDEKQPASA